MYVGQLMTPDVATCAPEDRLNQVAHILWERDCGVVPVVDADRRVVGILTDRDICMAAYFKNQLLTDIEVSDVMSSAVQACRTDDPVERAEEVMGQARIRRLPVLDDEGRLAGIVSLNDLAREVARPGSNLSTTRMVETMASICEPRRVPASTT